MSVQEPTETRPEVGLREWAAWLGSLLARAAAALDRARPLRVLAVLVVVQWLAVLALARDVRHAGFIYYQGGDQLWYFTGGWLLAHGHLPATLVGYGWSALLAPLALVFGPDLVSSLPAIVLLNVLVLLPVAICALYGIAARIGGRLFGYWAVFLWIVVPFIGVRYTNVGYHQKYTELLLPQGLGLTALADFPTMVAALVSVYFCARVVFDEHPRLFDAVAGGVAAGAAVGIKPSTTLFLAGPVLALAFRRQLVPAAAFAVGMVPALLALAVWKERGLGYLPAFAAGAPVPLAAGAHGGGAVVAALDLGRYLKLDWHHLHENMLGMREHFWSARVVEWLVFAGAIGLGRRSRAALLLVGGWLAAFVVVKGTYGQASVEDGSVFRIMMPAFPAFVLLLASLVLLFPRVPRKLRAWRPARPSPSPRTRWWLLGSATAVTALFPLVAIAAASPLKGPEAVSVSEMPLPTTGLGLTAVADGGTVALSWAKQSPLGGPVFYRVLRVKGTDDVTCPASAGSTQCQLHMQEIGVTRDPRLVDHPGPGTWTYRVGVAANWLNDPGYGDVYFESRPVAVSVR